MKMCNLQQQNTMHNQALSTANCVRGFRQKNVLSKSDVYISNRLWGKNCE